MAWTQVGAWLRAARVLSACRWAREGRWQYGNGLRDTKGVRPCPRRLKPARWPPGDWLTCLCWKISYYGAGFDGCYFRPSYKYTAPSHLDSQHSYVIPPWRTSCTRHAVYIVLCRDEMSRGPITLPFLGLPAGVMSTVEQTHVMGTHSKRHPGEALQCSSLQIGKTEDEHLCPSLLTIARLGLCHICIDLSYPPRWLGLRRASLARYCRFGGYSRMWVTMLKLPW